MSVASSLSEEHEAQASQDLRPIRANAGADISLSHIEGATRLKSLEERGGIRVKFPKTERGTEAILINTGGGMLGGDHYRFSVTVNADAQATVATQSAERIYRSLGDPTRVAVDLQVNERAELHWLPQETVFFSGAQLSRSITARLETTASVLLAESTIFGRAAMGEIVTAGAFRDRWRIWRDGTLIFAEDIALNGNIAHQLAAPAVGNRAHIMTTVFFCAPGAEDARDRIRDVIDSSHVRVAVSAWNGTLVVRALARDWLALQANLVRTIQVLSSRPLPRVWNTGDLAS